MTERTVPRRARAYSRSKLPPRETPMEVLLLLLDEIDDLCRIAWQRTLMVLGDR